MIRYITYKTLATWALPVAGFVGFTFADGVRSRWQHRHEPRGIYNTAPKTYGRGWKNR